MNTEALPLQVVGKIPPGIDLPPDAVASEFRKLATDVLNAANKAVGKYRELVAFIRKNQLQPSYVRPVLADRGFLPPNISAIIKVADSAQPDFDAFMKGTLGFRAALQLSRDNGKNTETAKAVAAHRERESAKFKRELEDLLGLYVPLSGGLPKYLQVTLKGDVNGYPYSLKLGRTTKAGK